MLGGLLLAVATITFGVDHVVAGFAINILAPGLCRLPVQRALRRPCRRHDHPVAHDEGDDGHRSRCRSCRAASSWATRRPTRSGGSTSKRWFFISDVAGLLKGFTTNLAYTTMLALFLIPISAYVLWRTAIGLRLRSSARSRAPPTRSASPSTACSTSPSTISGFLAGLGGAWLAIDVRAYNQGQTAGRGYQGLAAVIFGNWRPGRDRPSAPACSPTPRRSRSRSARHRCWPCSSWPPSCSPGWRIRLLTQAPVRRRRHRARRRACSPSYYYSITETVNNQLVFITPYLVTLLVLAFSSQRLRPPACGRPAVAQGRSE